jgi:hypothetical protein
MIGENTVSFSCRNDDRSRFVQVRFTICLEDHADADVSTELLYEPKLPEVLRELAHQSIYDGVYAGLAYDNIPFPLGGVTVKVIELNIASLPDVFSSKGSLQFIANALEAQIMGAVAGLYITGMNLKE